MEQLPRPRHRHRLHRRALITRLLQHFAISLLLLVASLAIGIWGYRHYEHVSWTDAFLNSAMLLGGMGPVKTDLSEGGKVFAGLYALYSGLMVIGVTGLLLAPGVHFMMKRVHWEERDHPE
jgi:hypothetical protein